MKPKPITSTGALTLVLVWRWIGQYEQLLGYRKTQRSQEPWGPSRKLVKLCILLTWKEKAQRKYISTGPE